MSKQRAQLITYGLPFMAFMIVGWYGIASVMQSKRELRMASKGLDSVEEMDPVERMRARYGIDGGAAQSVPQPEIRSLEEELQDTLSKIDLRDFEYKPVPRTADEE